MDNFVSFDGLGSTFLHNIYGSSKGRIRTDLIGEDLDFILELMKDRGSLSVLDLGCGTGFFSSRLAALGHHADLCDVSEEMIAEAEKFAAAQHTQQNMNFFCASAFELPCQITGRTYDLILCHAVMEWVEDQRKLLEIIKSRLSPGGELSLLVYNRDALLYQSLIVGNFNYISCNFQSKHRQKLTPKYPVEPAELEHTLQELGFTIQRKTGIRVFHDYVRDKKIQTEKFDEILKYEKNYARDPRFINLGRYIHYICRNDHDLP